MIKIRRSVGSRWPSFRDGLLFVLLLAWMRLHSQDVEPALRTSIYDVQFTSDSSGNSDFLGKTVTISGITTAAFPDGYTVAEDSGAWHSIFVFSKRNSPALGDELEVTGTVREYNGLTEIADISAVNVLANGKTIEASPVDARTVKAEGYESVLVRIFNAIVTGLDPNGEWTVADSSGTLVCDDKNDYLFFPKVDDLLDSLTGVLFLYNHTVKLEPRSTADIGGSTIPHYAIRGDIVTMNGDFEVLRDAFLEIRGDRIQSISSKSPPGVDVFATDGFIFPGLIDAHNHPQWNVLDAIPFETTFSERYEWQQTGLYQQVRDQFNDIMNYGGDGAQLANLFKLAEVRAGCSGTTTIQGFNCMEHSYDSFARQGIGINNAERFPGRVYSDAFPLSRDPSFWRDRRSEYWERFVIHLAEGSTPAALQEYHAWRDLGFLDGRTVIVHGIPLGKDAFSQMAQVGAHLVWSPSSNGFLYGVTADIPSALDAGVNVALAPDWTESGRPDLLAELKFAGHLSDSLWGGQVTARQLAACVTRNAAKALGLEGRKGSIATGMDADLAIIPKIHPDPYASLLNATPADIRLTVVCGRPLVGDPDVMDGFPFLETLEDITVGGRNKKIGLAIRSHAIEQSDKPLSNIMNELAAAYEVSDPKACKFLTYDCGSPSGVVQAEGMSSPMAWILFPNYPNPFNAVTSVEYVLPVDGHATLKVYDESGRVVETLVDGHESRGIKSVEWHAGRFASGIFFCVLETACPYPSRQVGKMTLVK